MRDGMVIAFHSFQEGKVTIAYRVTKHKRSNPTGVAPESKRHYVQHQSLLFGDVNTAIHFHILIDARVYSHELFPYIGCDIAGKFFTISIIGDSLLYTSNRLEIFRQFILVHPSEVTLEIIRILHHKVEYTSFPRILLDLHSRQIRTE